MWKVCAKVLSWVLGSRSFSQEHFTWLDLSRLPQMGWVSSPKVTFNVPWMDLTVDLCCQKAFLFSSRTVAWQHLGSPEWSLQTRTNESNELKWVTWNLQITRSNPQTGRNHKLGNLRPKRLQLFTVYNCHSCIQRFETCFAGKRQTAATAFSAAHHRACCSR